MENKTLSEQLEEEKQKTKIALMEIIRQYKNNTGLSITRIEAVTTGYKLGIELIDVALFIEQ